MLDLRHLRSAPIEWNAHEYFAAEIIQRSYRGFRAREAMHAHKQREIKRERVNQAFHISSALLTSFIGYDERELHADTSSPTLALAPLSPLADASIHSTRYA